MSVVVCKQCDCTVNSIRVRAHPFKKYIWLPFVITVNLFKTVILYQFVFVPFLFKGNIQAQHINWDMHKFVIVKSVCFLQVRYFIILLSVICSVGAWDLHFCKCIIHFSLMSHFWSTCSSKLLLHCIMILVCLWRDLVNCHCGTPRAVWYWKLFDIYLCLYSRHLTCYCLIHWNSYMFLSTVLKIQ